MRRLFSYLLRFFFVLFILVNAVTAFHAYKFTHFYDYSGAPNRTPEGMSTWQKLKSVLFGINAYKQKNSISPDSSFQVVYLKSSTAPKLEAWYLPVEGSRGTVCMFHGHGATKSAMFAESEALRKMGFNTLLLDFRAHGASEGNTCTIGYEEAEDVKLAFDFARSKGASNIILWGNSMGAAAVTRAVAVYTLSPSKIILEMPFGSIAEAASGRIRMMGLPGEPLASLVTFWGGVEHGFWAFRMKPSEYVKEIKVPVLLQWGRKDPRVTEKETMDIYNNIRFAKKLVVYEHTGHESLYKNEPGKWVSSVVSFLQ